jgi:hypothetical protein
MYIAVVVNMILINMMMAIINMAFEEVKAEAKYNKNKFELFDYMKQTSKEIAGTTIAEPIVPDYAVGDDHDSEEDEINTKDVDDTDQVNKDFRDKTDHLLDYIEATYLQEGFTDTDEGKRVWAKLNAAEQPPPCRGELLFLAFSPGPILSNLFPY